MQEVFKKKTALLSFYYLDGNIKYSFTASEKEIEDLKAKIDNLKLRRTKMTVEHIKNNEQKVQL
jgi:hypothetical protein